MTTAAPNPPRPTPAWIPLLIVAGIWAALFLLRISAPPDLLDKDQERPAAYMLDAARNGHWIVQRDDFQNLPGHETLAITSKPPLYTWLGAGLVLLLGRMSAWSFYLPTGLAMLGSALLIWHWGRRYMSPAAGLAAALMLLTSSLGVRMLCQGRTDPLFTFTVTLALLLAFRAWERQGGWVWPWLALAAATLTKGPAGALFVACALGAGLWCRRGDPASPPLRPRLFPGLLLFLALTLGWLLLAYGELGDRLLQKMIGSELVGHAVAKNGHLPGSGLFKPALYLASRYLPWSPLAVLGLVTVFRRPAAAAAERRLERFLACFILGSLAILGLASHQRPDLIMPLLPAASLLGARELTRLPFRRWLHRPAAAWWAAAGTTALLIATYAAYYHGPWSQGEWTAQTVAVRDLAKRLEASFGRRPEIVYAEDAVFALQFYLDTMTPRVPTAEAAGRLQGAKPCLVAVRDVAALQARLPPGTPLHEVDHASLPGAPPVVAVVSNVPLERLRRQPR
ncbi:MAG: glycosyltransferase family 39 protein [Lentisphaeria bacterium]|jgi:4-amino-4-deoxy-L-arabinose transferase-like glycosyltransferase